MERIPEPELMEEREQAIAYAKANFEEPHRRIVETFKQFFPDFSGQGYALDLGCGPADISIRMAQSYPDLYIHGVDGSQAMLDLGRASITERRLLERVKLVKCFIPNADLPMDKYDLIFSNSLLHHLHNPEVLWQTIKRYGDSSSTIFIVDLYRPENKREAQRIVQTYSAGEPPVLRKDFFNSLLAAFTQQEVKDQLEQENLNYLNLEKISDRHMAVFGRLK